MKASLVDYLLLTNAIISLIPAIAAYAIARIVYPATAPPWAPYAAGAFIWTLVLIILLFAQYAHRGEQP